MSSEKQITGIWLRRVGAENDPLAKVVVEVEYDNSGEWIEAIRESIDANFSHCWHRNEQ